MKRVNYRWTDMQKDLMAIVRLEIAEAPKWARRYHNMDNGGSTNFYRSFHPFGRLPHTMKYMDRYLKMKPDVKLNLRIETGKYSLERNLPDGTVRVLSMESDLSMAVCMGILTNEGIVTQQYIVA